MADTTSNIQPSRNPSIQGIKQCLQRCQREFLEDTDKQPLPDDSWIQVRKKKPAKKPREGSQRKGKAPRGAAFADNKAFVQGIYVVALGLRCAYLVDTISVKRNHAEIFNQHFSSLAVYQDVAFLCEENTEQVYIVNRRLLKARFGSLTGIGSANDRRAAALLEGHEILWLQTDWGKPIIPTRMSRTLQAAIEDLLLMTLDPEDITVKDAPRKSLSITIQPRDVPALSAWLLEYPVGYTFSEDPAVQSRNDETAGALQRREEQTNLDGEPLVLVKVNILGDRELGRRYDLLALSYPSKLLDELGSAEQATCSKDTMSTAGGEEVRQFLQRIPVRLKERYESRLAVAECGERPEIEVTTDRVRLEKVVL